MTIQNDYDFIIVGAGSTGCLLANRLSTDPQCRVLLIEAGPDPWKSPEYPQELLQAHKAVMEGFNWPYRAVPRETGLGGLIGSTASIVKNTDLRSAMASARVAAHQRESIASFSYPLGKVLGGSSAVNGSLATLPTEFDIAQWSIDDGLGWDYHQIEQSKESLLQALGVPLQCFARDQLQRSQQAFLSAAEQRAWPTNSETSANSSGCSLLYRSVYQDRRRSSAEIFLQNIRDRDNLTIVVNSQVDTLLWSADSKAISGVSYRSETKQVNVTAARTVLCAGAINTPSLLMRSGIGPAEQLQAKGIECKSNLSGVGQKLMDHPSVGLWGVPNDGFCKAGEDLHQTVLRMNSSASNAHGSPHIYMVSSVETAQIPELKVALGSDLAASLTVVLGRPKSRGYVSLQSADYKTAPKIVLNVASEEQDVLELMRGIREAWALMQSTPLKEVFQRVFLWNQKIIDNDRVLKSTISSMVRGSWHACGTAAMGSDENNMSVVDFDAKVYGVDNLYIADASIFPVIPEGPPNLSCMVIAEHLARRWLNQ